MKKLLLSIISGIVLFTNSFSQTAHPGCVDGNIYLKYKEGTVKAKIANPENISAAALPGLQSLSTKYGITHVEKPYHQATDSKDLQRVYKVQFSNIMGVESLIKDLSANPAVEYAEKVPLAVISYTPNDPMYAANNWHLLQINAPNAWNVYNGTSTITVAVVDNAIMTSHPDLLANIWNNPGEIPSNGIDDDGNGWIDDGRGWDVGDNDNNVLPPNTTFSHGTHCSGIVGARTDNTVGIAAIGFNVQIIPVKATANSAGANTITNGYGGIIYAARSKARVISCSWGGTVSATTDQSVIDYAWSKGCIIICAAANDGNNVLHYPAAYNNVYAVASTGVGDVKSGFSCYGSWVDIAAPGENIYSTIPNTTYGQMSGTSMATPLVAGLAGLMLSKNPYMTQTQVLNCISSTA
ncbi:MAG: S8 family peptidase, partial [Bacteroidia bacterium]